MTGFILGLPTDSNICIKDVDGIRLKSISSPNEIHRSVQDSSLDFVKIRGFYREGLEVLMDIWWPKLKPNGFIIGEYGKSTEKPVKYFAGYRGLKLVVDGETFKITKSERPPEFLSGSVILVGNGPSLMDSNKGSLIDSHDEVIRFNNYRVEGFENHVGSKTTIWSCYGQNAQAERSNPCRKVLYIHGASNQPNWYEPDEIWRIPVSFYERVRDTVRGISKKEVTSKDGLLPSAGLVVLTWILERHFHPNVRIVGFDHFDRSIDRRHHYWLSYSASEPPEHDGVSERILFQKLAESGHIIT